MSIRSTHRPTTRAALLVLALLASLFAVVGLSATPAGALCDYGDEFGYSLYPGWGSETSAGAQCGGAYENGIYSGVVGDGVTDGSCVAANYRDLSYQGNQGVECTTGGSSTYGFYDQTGDRQADARLCRNQGCTGWYWSRGY